VLPLVNLSGDPACPCRHGEGGGGGTQSDRTR
jgi:hypothetical protein